MQAPAAEVAQEAHRPQTCRHPNRVECVLVLVQDPEEQAAMEAVVVGEEATPKEAATEEASQRSQETCAH